jgi:drug/metabolite transporter (DMT)-like permease
MSALALAVLLCIVSAAGYAGAAVLQERLARQRLAVLLRTPLWWAAMALNGIGAILHVLALRYGPLSLVQPFGVLTLVLAVPLAALLARRAVTRLEGRGIALTVTGLIAVLLFAGTTDGIAVLTSTQLIGLLLATAALLTALGTSGLWAAAAGGVAFGVSSALTQTVAVHVMNDGLSALLNPTVAVAVSAIAALSTAGMLFTQRSYRDGLGAPLAVSTLANPVAAAAIGLLLLGEQITGGTYGALFALGGAAVAAVGVTLLTRSQVRTSAREATATSNATAHPAPRTAASSRAERVPAAAIRMPPHA